MKKKIIGMAALGFPLGIAIGYLISIITSLIFGKGEYLPCVPQLAENIGGEMKAVVLQTFLSGVLGAVFAGASLIWRIDRWSLLKQTIFYFIIGGAFMFPIAYALYWMEHSIRGFALYFGVFTLIFIFIWLIGFMVEKHHLKKINSRLKTYHY